MIDTVDAGTSQTDCCERCYLYFVNVCSEGRVESTETEGERRTYLKTNLHKHFETSRIDPHYRQDASRAYGFRE
jgi:hypothetical protein